MKMHLEMRPPAPDEAAELTELCLRSKALHGYDPDFLDACRDELTVRPGTGPMIVAVVGGVRAGFAEISIDGTVAELEKLFVDPDFTGRGIGRALFRWAMSEAAAAGANRLMIDADPGAKQFYCHLGASEIGASPSGSIPGRTLPRLQRDLDAEAGRQAIPQA